MEVDFSIELLGASGPNDSIIITLPEGVTYISNSYQVGPNASFDSPEVENRGVFQVLKWKMIENLGGGSKIKFTLGLTGFGKSVDGGCENKTIQVQTIQAQEALCVSTNELCPISVQTGGAFIDIQVEFPFFSIMDFVASANGNSVDYQLEIQNQGANTDFPLTVSFYLDVDGNGFFSPGDQLIETVTFNNSIDMNEIISLSGNLNIDPDDICRLIAVISPNDNCSCEFAQSLTDGQVSGPTVYTACSEEVIEIGVSAGNGLMYFWNNPLNISCTDCPMADFSFQNVSTDTVSFNYEVTEEGGVCPVRHLITVVVFPEPQIFASDRAICSGDTVVLSTSTASSHTWQGAGITNPDLPTQVVTPTETTTYMVEVESSGNCSDQLEITIEVTPSPIADAGQDTVMCNVVNPIQLNAMFDPNYEYFWQPTFQLNDFNIHNPTIIVNNTATYTLTVRDKQTGCEAMDEVLVAFEDVPDLAISENDTICAGETIQLQVNGAAMYSWNPFSSLDCGDCANVMASPSSTTTYYVTGTNQAICSNIDSVTVFVEGFVKNTSQDTSACMGTTLLIFGDTIKTDSFYCKVFPSLVDGCDSTHCFNVKFIPDSTLIDTSFCVGDTIILFDNQEVFESGTYVDSLENRLGCDSIITFEVGVLDIPNLPFSSDTLIVERGETVQLELPEGYDRYEWWPSRGLDNDSSRVVLASPDSTINYTGTYYNSNGCSVSIRFNVVVVDQCSAENVEIPNIFSPNGDGRNDLFKPLQIPGVEEVVYMKIFNRWGQKIYEGSGSSACWDGKTNGEDSPTDVYVYQIEIGCGTETTIKTSDLTLIR